MSTPTDPEQPRIKASTMQDNLYEISYRQLGGTRHPHPPGPYQHRTERATMPDVHVQIKPARLQAMSFGHSVVRKTSRTSHMESDKCFDMYALRLIQ